MGRSIAPGTEQILELLRQGQGEELSRYSEAKIAEGCRPTFDTIFHKSNYSK